jgi:uncharacterized membrane protein YhhN
VTGRHTAVVLPYAVVLGVLVAALLGVVAKGGSRLEWIVKPAASATFVAAGLAAGALSTTWGSILWAGLLLAAAGDVALISDDRRAFLTGLVSFLLGHVAYAVAFAVRGVSAPDTAGAAALFSVAAIPILRWLWPHLGASAGGPAMRGPVVAYVVVITVMVALAVGAWGHPETGGDYRIPLGAFAFYLSDLSVARDRFVAPGFANRAWGLPLYYAAQLALASSPQA